MLKLRLRVALIAILAFFAALTLTALYRGQLNFLKKPVELEPAGAAAQLYLSQWQFGDYAGMYESLSAKAKKEWSFEDFASFHDSLYRRLAERVSLTYTDCVADARGQVTASFAADFVLFGAGNLHFDSLPMVLTQEESQWRVDFSPGMLLPNLTRDDTVDLVTVRPKRGEIFSSDGQVLARNTTADSVFIVVKNIPGALPEAEPSAENDPGTTPDPGATAVSQAELDRIEAEQQRLEAERLEEQAAFFRAMATALDMTEAHIEELVNSRQAARDGYVVLRAYHRGTIPDDVATQVLAFPGVGIDKTVYTRIREYPQGNYLAHTIGYMGHILDDDWPHYQQLGYESDEKVGLSGLEAAYEDTLHGQKGWLLARRDVEGTQVETYLDIPCVNGQDVWLTIDAKLQSRAEQLLGKLPQDQCGVIITMQPSTGCVTSIASYPNYDLNNFSWPMSQSEYDRLDKDPAKPLLNRATQGTYPPGSAIKPFTAALALDRGLISPQDAFTQETGLTADGRTSWIPQGFGSWGSPPVTRLLAVASPVNLRNAMVHSDNIYFAWLALKIGADEYVNGMKGYGFGLPFDADLTIRTGKVTKLEPLVSLQQLADSGYGQGELLVSPLQMAATFCAFANGGTVMRPQLVHHMGTAFADGMHYQPDPPIPPKSLYTNIISGNTLATIQPLLHQVCTQGTAQSIGLSNISGKTGTAEMDSSNNRVIAWFVGFVDDGSQDKLVLIMLETPTGQGGGRYKLAEEMFTN